MLILAILTCGGLSNAEEDIYQRLEGDWKIEYHTVSSTTSGLLEIYTFVTLYIFSDYSYRENILQRWVGVERSTKEFFEEGRIEVLNETMVLRIAVVESSNPLHKGLSVDVPFSINEDNSILSTDINFPSPIRLEVPDSLRTQDGKIRWTRYDLGIKSQIEERLVGTWLLQYEYMGSDNFHSYKGHFLAVLTFNLDHTYTGRKNDYHDGIDSSKTEGVWRVSEDAKTIFMTRGTGTVEIDFLLDDQGIALFLPSWFFSSPFVWNILTPGLVFDSKLKFSKAQFEDTPEGMLVGSWKLEYVRKKDTLEHQLWILEINNDHTYRQTARSVDSGDYWLDERGSWKLLDQWSLEPTLELTVEHSKDLARVGSVRNVVIFKLDEGALVTDETLSYGEGPVFSDLYGHREVMWVKAGITTSISPTTWGKIKIQMR